MTESARVFSCADDLLRIDAVSRESLPALEAYVALLLRWQARINLIGPDTVANIWHRHIADSLQILPHLPQHAETVLDIGSGAGLPGLPLAIACAGRRKVTFHLVESNGKKAAFLREAVRRTQAAAVVHTARIESLDSAALQEPADIVTARAVAPLSRLLGYAQKTFENGAVGLFHKGQDVDRELTEAAKYWKVRADRTASLTNPNACILIVNEATRVG